MSAIPGVPTNPEETKKKAKSSQGVSRKEMLMELQNFMNRPQNPYDQVTQTSGARG